MKNYIKKSNNDEYSDRRATSTKPAHELVYTMLMVKAEPEPKLKFSTGHDLQELTLLEKWSLEAIMCNGK